MLKECPNFCLPLPRIPRARTRTFTALITRLEIVCLRFRRHSCPRDRANGSANITSAVAGTSNSRSFCFVPKCHRILHDLVVCRELKISYKNINIQNLLQNTVVRQLFINCNGNILMATDYFFTPSKYNLIFV